MFPVRVSLTFVRVPRRPVAPPELSFRSTSSTVCSSFPKRSVNPPPFSTPYYTSFCREHPNSRRVPRHSPQCLRNFFPQPLLTYPGPSVVPVYPFPATPVRFVSDETEETLVSGTVPNFSYGVLGSPEVFLTGPSLSSIDFHVS